MINFILNDTDSSEVFKNQACQQEGVVFAPKLVHTGSFTIESYLEFGKVDFDFTPLENLYEQFQLPPKSRRLFELDDESLLIIHYWSYLLVDSKHTIIDLPSNDFSTEFIQALKHLISYYNKREITIITKNSQVINILKELDGTPKKLLPVYKFKMNKLQIANMFIGEKLLVLATLIMALIIIIFAMTVDSKLVGEYASYIELPNNVIFIDNTSTDCDFNKVSYQLDEDSCMNSQPLSYSALSDLFVFSSEVDNIIFDDEYNITKLDEELTQNQHADASVPVRSYSVLDQISTIPCLDPDETPSAITCTEYNPNNSLISLATAKNQSTLKRNIEANRDAEPSMIIIETSDTAFISKELAYNYPSINIYTKKSTESYIRKSNFKLIVNSILSGTLISLISVLILNLLISQLKLYLRGHKYMLSYLTKKPLKIHHIFYSSQVIYFSVLFLLGSVIASNLITSLTAFLLSSYLGLLNIALWIIFSDINGTDFKDEEQKLCAVLRNKPKHNVHKA